MNGPSDKMAGKRALITGGAQGLGLCFGEMFRAEGAQVVLTDIQEDKVRTAAEGIGATGLRHDVTSADDWKAAIDGAVDVMGGLDVLVHNAGIGSFGNIETEDFDTYRKIMAIDCDSVFLGTKAALPALKKSGNASIVIISSVAGLIADGNFLSYNVAKAGVAMMSKSIALHCARHARKGGPLVRCNSVHPVFTRTPILDPMIAMRGSQEEGEAALVRQIPMGRLGEPEEVGAMVTYLASDDAKFVTGSSFTIDGGITATATVR